MNFLDYICIVGSATICAWVGFGLWRLSSAKAIAPSPSSDLIEAMREVDAMLPDSPPIAPRTWGPADLSRLLMPEAKEAEVGAKPEPRDVYVVRDGAFRPDPPPLKCTREGCVYCAASGDERRRPGPPPPQRPAPTRAPGPGMTSKT